MVTYYGNLPVIESPHLNTFLAGTCGEAIDLGALKFGALCSSVICGRLPSVEREERIAPGQ